MNRSATLRLVRKSIGTLAVAIFGVFAWMGQTTPSQAMSAYGQWYAVFSLGRQPPEWLDSALLEHWGPLLFVLLGSCIFFWTFYPQSSLSKQKPNAGLADSIKASNSSVNRLRSNWFSTFFSSALIPMHEAARLVYENAIEHKSAWSAKSLIGADPEQTINTLANLIAGKVKAYGRRRPSSRIEIIEDAMNKNCQFSVAASRLRVGIGTDQKMYENIMVRRSDIIELMKQQRRGLKTNTVL